MVQCRRRVRREAREMGVVTLGVSLSSMTASAKQADLSINTNSPLSIGWLVFKTEPPQVVMGASQPYPPLPRHC